MSLVGGEYSISSNGIANFRFGSFWNSVAWPKSAFFSAQRLVTLTEHDFQFRLWQFFSNAAMCSIPKPQRVLWVERSMYVEFVRIREHIERHQIAIPGLAGRYDSLPRFYRLLTVSVHIKQGYWEILSCLPAILNITSRYSTCCHCGTLVISTQLFDEFTRKTWILFQIFKLLWVLQ